jgi:peroxiredoxin
MKKIFLVFTVAVAIGISAWFIWRPTEAAPTITLTGLDGRQFTLRDLRGKVVLIKFWATSCTTCVRQMPETIATQQKYAAQGYETIAIAMRYDPPNYVVNFVQTRKLPFTVVIDSMGKIAQAFGNVQLTPTAFLINKQGQVVKRYVGEYDRAEFEATLEKTLASS